MKSLSRFSAVLVLAGAVTAISSAQTPPPAPGGQTPAVRAGGTPRMQAAPRRRSIVQHYAYPYPEYYHGDQTAGFRNPGNVGRNLEYYPPGNTFERGQDPTRVASFDRGGGAPDRAEQLAAQQIGIQSNNSLQNHIDNYARPAFGVGFFGGFY